MASEILQQQAADPEKCEDTSKKCLTVSDALEKIFETGSGAWVTRCCVAIALSTCVQGLEANVSAYIATCSQYSFHREASGAPSIAAANYAGQLAGCLLLCPLGDVIGRKKMLVYLTALVVVSALLSALSPTLNSLVFMRAVVGFFQGPCILGLDFVMEVVPLERRGQLTNYVCTVAWGVGTMFINVLAWIILPHYGWRPLLACTAIPFAVDIWLLSRLAESPRWLVSQGRLDEAMDALEIIAKANDTSMPCGSLKPQEDELVPLSASKPEDSRLCSSIGNIIHEYRLLFTADRMPMLLFLMFQWLCIGFSYSAMVLYDGDIVGLHRKMGLCEFDYGFNVIVGASEILGGVVMRPFIDQPHLLFGGRKGVQIVGYICCALGVLFTGLKFFPVLLWACIARALINGTSGVMCIQGAELLEVRVRSTGTGFLNIMLLVGSTLAPYWIYASYSVDKIAMGISVATILGMLFTLLLPETALIELATLDMDGTTSASACDFLAEPKDM